MPAERDTLPFDSVLLNIQDSIASCTSMLQCVKCANNSDQEVLIVAIMCVRCVILQIVAARASKENDAESNTFSSSLSVDDLPMRLGGFELKGNDKDIMLQVLQMVTTRKIEAMLKSLGEILTHKKRLQTAGGTLEYVEQMTDDLTRLIRAMQ
jgi:hypothetical protein